MPTVEVEVAGSSNATARRSSSHAAGASTPRSRRQRQQRRTAPAAAAAAAAPLIVVLLLLLPPPPSVAVAAMALGVPCPRSCRAARCRREAESEADRIRPPRSVDDARGRRRNGGGAAATAGETVMERICHQHPAAGTPAVLAAATASLPLETADLDAALEEQLGGDRGGRRVATLCGPTTEDRKRAGDESSTKTKTGRRLLLVGGAIALGFLAAAGAAVAAYSAGGGALGGGGIAAGALPWLLGRGGECVVDGGGGGGTLSLSVLLASVREMALAASENSKSVGQFAAEELFPTAVETLRKMLLMEFWRRVWTAAWGATRRVWRERATSLVGPSPSVSCGEYLPELVCRAGKFVETTVRSGTRRLFQKGVERRVQGYAVEWWSYGWSSVVGSIGSRMVGLTATSWSWSDTSSTSPESPVVMPATSD